MSDKLIQCPYVPSHQVAEGTRFQTHVVKCRKNTQRDVTSPFHARAMKIDICSFDNTHHVHRDSMASHIQGCLAAKKVMAMKYDSASAENVPAWKRNVLLTNEITTSQPQATEDWDDEVAQEPVCYNPSKKLENGPNYSIPYGKTPSERRLFRKENRLRANQPSNITDRDDEFVPPPVQRESSKENEPSTSEAYKPLRRPNKVESLGPVSTSHGRGNPMKKKI